MGSVNPGRAPSTKLQAPEKLQTANTKAASIIGRRGEFGFWRLVFLWCLGFGVWSLLSVGCSAAPTSPTDIPAPKPPFGFIALFNGNDLTGWRGGKTFDHRRLLAMPPASREAQIAEWTAAMKPHWRVENGELVNDGQG